MQEKFKSNSHLNVGNLKSDAVWGGGGGEGEIGPLGFDLYVKLDLPARHVNREVSFICKSSELHILALYCERVEKTSGKGNKETINIVAITLYKCWKTSQILDSFSCPTHV